MERFLELLIQFIQNKYFFVLLLVFLIIVIIVMLRKNKSVKALEAQLSDLEVDYNTIKSMPLTFKLNKARALAKVNNLIEKEINGYVLSYETIQKASDRMAALFIEANDAIVVDELDVCEACVNEIEELVTITLKNVSKLNDKLDSVLEQELKLRSEVTSYKERFRDIKETLNKQNGVYNFSEDVLNEYIQSSENEFTAFDEWMYVSEFDKAANSLTRINDLFAKIDNMLIELPDLLPYAKEIIPNKIADVSTLYSEVLDANLFVEDLDVTQSLSVISASLSSNLSDLRVGDIEKVKNSLETSNDNLEAMRESLHKELEANKLLVDLNKQVKLGLGNNSRLIEELKIAYADLSSRYTFIDLENKISDIEKSKTKLTEENIAIGNKFKTKMPVSKMLEILNVYNDELNLATSKVVDTQAELDEILGEEKRANQQLIKLYLIINEVSVKINEHNIPAISNDYLEDVAVAKQHIRSIENILSEDTLNIKLLNSTLSESIDYIYKLYNNVNNIVGMAVMVENAIVFGNRYRRVNNHIDSELAKSEFYFRNGEYTQALTTVLAVLERLHPNDYEKMIRENSIYVL
ncbi:MAG: hypothetical protein GX074_05585 [Erysipelothrix sp.]|nr:hypothetical protein [Erysipelothrix sp.]